MSKVNNIIGQLQDRLTMKFGQPGKVDTEGSLSGGPEFVNQYPTDDEEDIDVPKTPETDYVTHRPFILPTGSKRGNKLPFESKSLKEQEDEETPEEEATAAAKTGDEIADTVGGGEPVENETGLTAPGPGMDSGLGGFGFGLEQEEPKTAGQVGRIYELKKIYARLTSIESYLGNESAPELLNIRDNVSKAIELFEVVSSNFDSYKDKLDEIIVTFYKFILEVYSEVKNYFKKEANSGD
ncbi:MAG: hypothetical protein ACFFG0_00200 [Candidatus Thorarchaeota archaeon]